MRRVGVVLTLLAAVALIGCGSSSSEPTEAEVARLLEAHTAAANAECVKSTGDHEFSCMAVGTEGNVYLYGSNAVRIKVTVGESGKTIFVDRCDATGEGHGVGNPCTGIG